MITLRSSAQLKAIFNKTIQVMGARVEWNGMFIVHRNNMIMPGTLKSLIFSLDSRKIVGTVVELEEVKKDDIYAVKDSILENAFNMLLYIFGKWDQIKGLKVEKNFDQLESMIDSVISEIDVTVEFTKDKCRFYRDEIEITYEDVIESFITLLEPEKAEEIINDQDQENQDDQEDDNTQSEDDVHEEQSELDRDNWFSRKYKIGLWHKIVWSSVDLDFKKEHLPSVKAKKHRIGKDYYLSNYKCPVCDSFLHMVVYPTTNEFLIDTDEGEVMLARAYTCNKCTCFYTPRPRTMLIEGAAYKMDFEGDQTAYEDYLDLTGENGAKVSNCNFNEYLHEIEEQERNLSKDKKKANQSELSDREMNELGNVLKHTEQLSDEELISVKDQMDSAYYPQPIIESYDQKVTDDLAKRKIKQVSSKDRSIKKLKKDRNAHNNLKDMVQNMVHKYPSKEQDHLQVSDASVKGRADKEKTAKEQTNLHHSSADKYGTDQSKSGRSISGQLKSSRSESVHLKPNQSKSGQSDPEYKTRGQADLGQSELGQLKSEQAESGQINSEQLKSEHFESGQAEPRQRKQDQLKPEQLVKLVQNTANESFDQMNKVYQNIFIKQKDNIPEEIREKLTNTIHQSMKERAAKELTAITSQIPDQLTKNKYHAFKGLIENYQKQDPEIEVQDALDKLKQKRNVQENKEISEFIKKINKRPNDRGSLMKVYEELKEQDFEQENKEPYLSKIWDKIKNMDEMFVKRICPDLTNITLDQAKEAEKRIREADILPELKEDILAKIDRRLRLMKEDECEQLVEKFRKTFLWNSQDYPGIFIYDRRRMNDENRQDEDAILFKNAIDQIAGELQKYEYPVFYCDMSRNHNGKNGFILTPEHLYYNYKLSRGVLDVDKINKLYENSSLLSKGTYASYHQVGEIKFAGQLKDTQISSGNTDDFISKLNEFIAYLQEKPESRNIDYMAKETHTVKCCYRCGFMFKEGDVCPRCGAYNK